MFQFLNILRKEAIDAYRDNRSLLAAFAFAIAGPFLIYSTLNSFAENGVANMPVEVSVSGGTYAPSLLNWLKTENVAIRSTSEPISTVADVEAADAPIVMVLSENYKENYVNSRPAKIRIYVDHSSERSKAEAERLRGLINIYSAKVSRSRLMANGVSPTQTIPISVDVHDLSRAGALSARYASMLSFLFLTGGFISGAFFIADTIAGERERHSLLPLMAQPVSPIALVAGKWIISSFLAISVTTMTVLVTGKLLERTPLADIGIRFIYDKATLFQISACLIPLALLAAALQLFLVARSKTYREAATYVQYTIFMPIIIIGATQIGQFNYGSIADYLPITGQDSVVRSLLLGADINTSALLATTLFCVVISLVLVFFTSRILGDESTLR